jgi:hypothetical protein
MRLPAPSRSSAIAATALAVQVCAAPGPSQAAQTLRTAASATEASAPLVALLALLAWAAVGWLLLVALATAAGRVPGAVGRCAGRAARRLAPAAVRRLVEVALGLTVVTGVVGASPAFASPAATSPPPSPTAASLDWPTAPAAPAPDRSPQRATAPVVVRPGDSLWAIAAGRLPDDASEAEIAQAWPAWWGANREAIGTDPGLIHPGLQLIPPAGSTPS